MDKAITYNLNEDFIENLAGFVDDNFIKKGADISRLAFVFEGKRPALFLRRALLKRTGGSFFSPAFFSIDEFVRYALSKKTPFEKMPNMESWYMFYNLVKNIAPEILKGREKFSEFLPWAREISKFIDTLDMEDIPQDSLRDVQASAAIGYDIPENINAMLKNVIALRNAYHTLLPKKNSFPRGFIYLSAAKLIPEVRFDEFEKILFCGFFYMEKTEQEIVKHLFKHRKAVLLFQGDEDKWPPLKNTFKSLNCSVKPGRKSENNYSLKLYAAFDQHSQVCAVREILKKIDKLDSTVVVLPDSSSMIPLVSEIGKSFGDFNVSLGYPLERSSLYSLFEFIVRAQKTKRGEKYYAKDYIAALSQPLVKNLKILSNFNATRILVHKIEEALLGMENTSVSGRLFVKPEEIESDTALYKLAAETLRHMDIETSVDELEHILKEIHLLLFTLWEEISNFRNFAESLGKLLDILVRKSFMENYPLNLKIAERMYSIRDELYNASFSREDFSREDVFKIFRNMLENEMVAFAGSPLKGIQILGMLETRSLNFENVIIMDANESILPKLRLHDPLIPYDVKLNLGMDIIKNEEEIQRYQFRRLISAAKEVHLIYEENPQKEKSRFLEGLIWERQQKKKSFEVIPLTRLSFSVNVLPVKTAVKKTKEMIKFLKNRIYSASSLNTYIHCPLRFYYKYVLGLEEKEKLPEEPEGREIGIFIHQLLDNVFAGFIGEKPEINQKFRRSFFKIFDERFKKTFSRRMRSGSFLLEEVMRFKLERFLDFEENSPERNVKEILYLERKFKEKLEFGALSFDFTYVVDRVDKLQDGSVLILDYKTGIDTQKPQRTALLENMEAGRKSIKERLKSFQLPLYYYFEKKKYKEENLNAALYSLRSPKLTYFPDKNSDTDKTIEICLKALGFTLQEILDAEKTFAADYENENNCRYCAFKCMCR
ncbi:MAG: PD-(D/E)XK nuclease family protein [Candidatus Ratteibacteria bacterium]|nr:PD-(D/E)XK nuclease family protein [Candidatus Ratteibacteria bacterium]